MYFVSWFGLTMPAAMFMACGTTHFGRKERSMTCLNRMIQKPGIEIGELDTSDLRVAKIEKGKSGAAEEEEDDDKDKDLGKGGAKVAAAEPVKMQTLTDAERKTRLCKFWS